MFKNLRQNESGVILFTVLAIIMVMGIFTLAIISINVSEVKTEERQIRRLQAEQFAQGVFWLAYSNLTDGSSNPHGQTMTQTIDGKTFTATILNNGIVNAPSGTNMWIVSTNY